MKDELAAIGAQLDGTVRVLKARIHQLRTLQLPRSTEQRLLQFVRDQFLNALAAHRRSFPMLEDQFEKVARGVPTNETNRGNVPHSGI